MIDAELGASVLACRFCRDRATPRLPHEPRPILRLSNTARLLIASQAPGVRAHASGVPFNDPSGERLRDWMGIGRDTFYDANRVAIVPMGFCFPGHDAQKGDLPPRKECRLLWHDRLFGEMPNVETILAIGLHALRYHAERLSLPVGRGEGLGQLVARWRDFSGTSRPRVIPLPHPSWRNSGWLKRNPWFEREVLPVVRAEVARLTENPSNP